MIQHPLADHWITLHSLEIPYEAVEAHLAFMKRLDDEVEGLMGPEGRSEEPANTFALAMKLLRHLGMDPVSFQKLSHEERIGTAIASGLASKDAAACLVDNLGILVAQEFTQSIHGDVRTQLAQALCEKKERELPPQLRAKGMPRKNPTDEIEEGIRQLFLDIFHAIDSEE